MNGLPATIPQLFHTLQRSFFPDLEHEAGPIPPCFIRLSHVLQLIHRQPIELPEPCWLGRPRKSRRAILNALIAKAFLGMPTTVHLIERLQSDRHLRLVCGFESCSTVPGESVFSRVFAEFAKTGLLDRVHEAIVAEACDGKIIQNIARDSMPIEAREKPTKKKPEGEPLAPRPAKRKRGRPRKGEAPVAKPVPRLKQQLTMSLQQMLDDLPRACDVGMKRNSHGHTTTWIGYKLHIDTGDLGLPISVILTSASMHDSQAAIPLATVTAARADNFYDLMDAAYDCLEIKEHSKGLGHVPIIDPNPRRNAELKQTLESETVAQRTLNWKPAEAVRYNARTSSERSNSRVKDEFGGRTIRVRGHAKVLCHLMFGVVVLSADQLIRHFT